MSENAPTSESPARLYQCVKHPERQGPIPAEACSDCFRDQEEARAAKNTAERKVLRFRRIDAGRPVKAEPAPEPDLAQCLAASLDAPPPPAAPVEVPALAPVALELPAVPGPRCAGIDPGKEHVAVFIAEGAAPPLRVVKHEIFDVKDATDTADVARVVDGVIGLLSKYGVERVTIERAVLVQVKPDPNGRAMIDAGKAKDLLLSAHVGGEIAGAVRSAFAQRPDMTIASAPVLLCSSTEWRNAARKAAKIERKGPKGRQLKEDAYRAARALFAGQIPDVAGDHYLDAAGTCLWNVLGAGGPKVVRPKLPKTTGPRPSKHRRRKERAEAKRVALGCKCAPGKDGKVRHVKDVCPIAIAANRARGESMKGNRNRAANGAAALEGIHRDVARIVAAPEGATLEGALATPAPGEATPAAPRP